MKAFEFASGVYWVGCVDYDHHDFHGYSKSPEGTTYNAYFIKDEKNTLIDTVSPGKAAHCPTESGRRLITATVVSEGSLKAMNWPVRGSDGAVR